MEKALDIAQYLLCKSHPDAGDYISNLKLQKLLYYAQGVHLVLHDSALFVDIIEAWDHGPVVPQVYHHYKASGSNGIIPPTDFDPSILTKKQKSVLDDVHTVFGQFSAWKLRNMTHSEEPWKNTPSGATIDLDLMKSYFQRHIVNS